MKITSLLIALLFGGTAVAKDISIICSSDVGGIFANSFSGSGKISFDEEVSSQPSQRPNAKATLSLALKTGQSRVSTTQDFDGTVKVLSAGELMIEESYGVVLTSKDKTTTTRMLLNGPRNQATARMMYRGVEYISVCDAVE